MKNFKWTIFVLAILSFSVNAFARGGGGSGVVLDASAMYLINNNTNGNTTTSTNQTLLDGVAGYRFSSPLFLGGLYSYDSTSSTTTNSPTSTNVYTSYGATVGLDTGDWYLLGTYIIGSEDDNTSNNIKTAYTGGSGYQFSLGYRIMVTSNFGIGPEVTYRYLSYTTQQVGGAASTSATVNHTALLPYISFTYAFGGSSN